MNISEKILIKYLVSVTQNEYEELNVVTKWACTPCKFGSTFKSSLV